MAGRTAIYTGLADGDGLGDKGRAAWQAANANFAELYPLVQRGAPTGVAPSGFFADNGVFVIGQAPSAGATATFSATSGAGVTMTMSAVTLLGAAADVGRVLTILDGGTYKYATVTAQVSTTVATVTLSGGALSSVGPFANNAIWLSGTPNTNTSGFSVPFDAVWPGLYLRFPANSVVAGFVADGCWCVMQSSTVGTAYNNRLPLLQEPSAPTTLVPFVTTGGGAYTQATLSLLTLASYTITGGSMGAYGKLRFSGLDIQNSSVNNKAYRLTFGGVIFFTVNPAANNVHSIFKTIGNCAKVNFQASEPAGGENTTIVAGPTNPVYGAIDTSVDQPLTFTQQVQVATDWAILVHHMIELLPAN